MTLFEGILIYAVSWWLVLFMVLPIGVRVPENPEIGHAASAPTHPRLRRKFLLTSLITLLVPLAMWGVTSAWAGSGIYHAGSSDCIAPVDHAADPSVQATDTNATLDNGVGRSFENVPVYLDAPAGNVADNSRLRELGAGVVQLGVVTTNTKTGETTLNGAPLGQPATQKPSHCP